MNTRALALNRAGWSRPLMVVAAVAALALSLFAVASPAAASADDQACNNIVNGGRSPDYVWVTVGASGLTVNWSTDADKFGSDGTVTVRGCYVPTNAGAIAQNIANDGSHTFPWSDFGLDGNPCPDENAEFGGSVDSPAVQTKKSDLINCANEPQPTPTQSVAPSNTPAQSSSPSETPEGSVLPGTGTPAPSNSPEGGVKGATGTPAPTPPDTATGLLGGGTTVPTVVFVLVLLASLGGLAYVNIGSARQRD